MMACRRMFHLRQLFNMKRVLPAYSTNAMELAEQMVHFNKRLPKRIDLQPTKRPFAKDLLIGKFDMDVMAYPEAQDSDRNVAFFKWLKPVEEFMKTVDARSIDRNKEIPDDIINKLNDLGVFAAHIGEDYGGLGFLESEYMKLLETLARVPAIALFFVKINRCVDIFHKYASQEQKLMYLPKIANGTIIPSYCLSETSVKDAKKIRSKAVLSQDDTYWELEGQKIFVPYADKADIFLTFAYCSTTGDYFSYDKTLSLLIVDKNLPNITIGEPIETVGIRGLKHFVVEFKNVPVPQENLVGEIGTGSHIYTSFMSERKHDIGAVAIGILRNFIDTLTYYMVNTTHFNKNLFEFDSAKEVLGKACHTLYNMEAATYMTTALMDLYKDQDCTMESSIVETYCAKECKNQIAEGIHLIGTPAYLIQNDYDLFFRDSHALTVFENSIIDNETFVALVGMQYVGNEMKEDIKKLRNPFDFPLFCVLFGEEKRLNHKIREHLHPSLMHPAKQLEVILYKLKYATYQILTNYGADTPDYHMDLRRYYELTSHAFVFSSVLARASRAYCIGLRNSEREIQIANCLAYSIPAKTKYIFDELADGQFLNGDRYYKEISDMALNNKAYFPEHPLTRNF